MLIKFAAVIALGAGLLAGCAPGPEPGPPRLPPERTDQGAVISPRDDSNPSNKPIPEPRVLPPTTAPTTRAIGQ